MELPRPPQDVELKNIIDKLAQFVARNGPEFEQMTKNKQKGNPKFGFLFGGEYFNYYQYKVTTEQAILKLKDGRGGDSNPPPPTPPQAPPAPNISNSLGNNISNSLSSMLMNAVQGISHQASNPMANMSALNDPAQAGLVAQWIVQHTQQQVQQQAQVHQPPPPPLPSAPPSTMESLTQQQNTLHEQINQSEQNLNAQHLVLVHHEDAQIEQEIRKSEVDKLQREAEELGVSLSDFDSVLQPIMDSCTKDSISNGKTWLLNRATCKAVNDLLARYLLFKVLDEPEKKFFRKLHVIYLVNDILHHCVRKHIEGFKIALEEVVVPMFVNASLGVTEEQQTKLNKLLMIWEKKNHYFPDEIVSQLKDPENSWERYKQQRLQDHSDIVDGIKLNTKNAVSTFQSQHLAFVTHAQQQIQALEQQKQNLEQQQQKVQAVSPAPPPEPKMSLSSISRPPPMFEREDDMSDPENHDMSSHDMARLDMPSHEMSRLDMSRHDLDDSPVNHDRPSMDPARLPPDAQRPDRGHDRSMDQGRGMDRMDRNSLSMDDHMSDRLHDIRDHRGPPQDFRASMDPRHDPFDMPPDHRYDMGHDPRHDGPIRHDPRFEPRFDSRHEAPPPPSMGGPLGTSPLPTLPLDLPINLNQPPPGFSAPPLDIQLPDLTRPPPGFPQVVESPFQPEDLLPSLPYFDLPAGLMVPLIRLEDYSYKPLDPDTIRLPPPAPPSERLLAAVKAFYMPPRHENPRDSDGWEKLGLYEYFRAKAAAKKQKELEIEQGIRPRSRSPTPVRSWQDQAKSPPPKRRYSSRSRSKSKEKEREREPRNNKRRSRRDRSRSPDQRPEQRPDERPERRERERDRNRDDRDRGDRDRDRDDRERDRERDDSRDSSREARSPTPPSFMGGGGGYGNPNSEDRLGESNKGHQLLKKMGWGGAGLGAKEQGIEQPISGGDVRDRQDQYKGVGINLNDPYENFRKNKGQAFINRMKARAEERAT